MFNNLFDHWGMAVTAFTIGGLLVSGSMILAAGVTRSLGDAQSRRPP